jgi:hypothetical protein
MRVNRRKVTVSRNQAINRRGKQNRFPFILKANRFITVVGVCTIRMEPFILLSLVVLGLALLLFGLYASPFASYQPTTEHKIDAEYTNGILTISGIMFGLWGFLLSKKPKRQKDWAGWVIFNIVTVSSFYLCFGLLILSILTLALTGVGLYSPTYTLIICTTCCIYSAVAVASFVHFYAISD